MANYQGDHATARSRYEESLAIFRELGDQRSIAVGLNNLGLVLHDQGDYAAACALHEESLAIRRELGDRHGMAYSLGNLGLVAHNQGDYAAARALYEECLAILWELGDRRHIAAALSNLANVALRFPAEKDKSVITPNWLAQWQTDQLLMYPAPLPDVSDSILVGIQGPDLQLCDQQWGDRDSHADGVAPCPSLCDTWPE